MNIVENEAMALLKEVASDELISRVMGAVAEGTHLWTRDASGAYGLVSANWDRQAVVVIYPAPLMGDRTDFEVDEVWMGLPR